MNMRRKLLKACLGSIVAPSLFARASYAAPLADVLERPALAVNLASKPSMVRIARAGDRLVAVGERGLVFASDDDGRTWRQAQVPVSVSLTGVQFVDERRGWAIGHGGVVLHTADGGQTWTRQHDGRGLPDGPMHPLLDLHFIDATHGWAVGAYGLALRTDDGGRRWHDASASLPNPKGLHLYALARQGDRLFVAGEQGLFLSMGLNGQEPQPIATPYRGSFFSATALAEGRLLLGGLRGTLLLRQAGGEFATIDSGTPQAIVSATLLMPQQQLALVDQSGRVLVGALPAGTRADFRLRPAEAERRWVSVTTARDGALVGACNIGVGRLAEARSAG